MVGKDITEGKQLLAAARAGGERWLAPPDVKVPPNARIDHWPDAYNRLDSLGFSRQQRMLI
jgi:hypothetical protein